VTTTPQPGPQPEDLIVPIRHTPIEELRPQAKTAARSAVQESDRITVKVQAYHEQFGEEAKAAQGTFAGLLETKHQVYERRQVVEEDWVALDVGWIPEGDVGYVLLENRKPIYSTVPGDEVAEEDARRIIYVRLGGGTVPGWVIRPGRVFMAEAGADTIYVRSDVGGTRLGVTIFPR
jgi:hypothetical protein